MDDLDIFCEECGAKILQAEDIGHYEYNNVYIDSGGFFVLHIICVNCFNEKEIENER
jgi:hypothetical protein